jgi:hypothetical protein
MSQEQLIERAVLRTLEPGLHNAHEQEFAMNVVKWVFGQPATAPLVSSEVEAMIAQSIIKHVGEHYGSVVMPDYVVYRLGQLSLVTAR